MALLALLAACSPISYVSDADREVGALLAEKQSETLDGRAEWVKRPEEVSEDVPEPTETDSVSEELPDADDVTSSVDIVPPAAPPPLQIDLEQALSIAVDSAREYVTRRETLYLRGLGLTGTRFDFGPQLAATVSHVWNKVEDTSTTGSATSSTTAAAFSASQLLSTGGTVRAGTTWSTTPNGTAAGERTFGSDVNFSLSQPLLRGAGYEASHEALTQSERDLVYELRDFELFRQDFSIGIAQDYFNLVSRRTRLSNEERNYDNAVFDLEKAKAFRQVDRNKDEDLFLARRRAIDAENRLLEAQTDYELAVDTFRIRLGLAPSVVLEISEVEPPFVPVRLLPDSAVDVAVHNRLDLITARDVVEDRERATRIASNGLLPDVDFDLDYARSNSNPTSDGYDTYNAAAGFSVEIPLQRTRERNTYRASLISLDRERRDYQLLIENTERDVRDRLRTLGRIEQQIELQRDNIAQEQRAVAVTEIRYEAGDAENRDLLDARQALIDAQNELIDLKVEHYISRLRLLRELGLLFIDDVGRMST
ncbi:MAG: hypothetical protein DHS20C15_16650 [Planctomycetota bacterium]|nr:MAG: hypothetical protein DHS20C15_16650 [Planctomycetota bacterium]